MKQISWMMPPPQLKSPRVPWTPSNAPGAASATLMSPEMPAFQRLGYGLLVVFLFIVYSRIFDIKFAFLHIPGMISRLMAVTVLLSGTFLAAFKSSIGKFMLGFTVLMFAAIPFSVWKGGSFSVARDSWLMNFVLFVGIAGMISTFRQCRVAMASIAWGVLVLALFSLKMGQVEHGRLLMSHGKFGNPNDLAQALLVGLPLWWLMLRQAHAGIFKILASGAILVNLATVLKTGSRGAVVALMVVGALLFWRSDFAGKVKIAMAGVVLFMVALVALPHTLKTRFATLLSEQAAAEEADAQGEVDEFSLNSAVASTASRKQMLIRSIILTAQHPVFGVGPGMFRVAEDQMAKSMGFRKGSWLETHNSYTQVSSEIGIPALICYLGMLFASMMHSRRIYKATRGNPHLRDINQVALSLNFMAVFFMITAGFSSVAYTNFIAVVAGLTAAFLRVTADDIAGAKKAPEPAAWSPQQVVMHRPSRIPQPA